MHKKAKNTKECFHISRYPSLASCRTHSHQQKIPRLPICVYLQTKYPVSLQGLVVMNGTQPDNEKLKEWWQQCIAGDTAAFAHVHAALFEGLYSYACKLLSDDALADDTVQELFIKIWNRRSAIGSIEKVKPFFFTSLRRQLLNQLRNTKSKQLKISAAAEPGIEFSQEEIIIKKEDDAGLKEKILQILNTLPERQREVIYLHFFEDMPLAQVAEVMAINYQSVQNLKQRALQNMRSASLFSLFTLLYAAYCMAKL
jgi:RNA polymerase sigma factor (sigma-70 family)